MILRGRFIMRIAVISDIHLIDDVNNNFGKNLERFNDLKCDFTVMCGDIVTKQKEELNLYKDKIKNNLVYSIAGNHDVGNRYNSYTTSEAEWEEATGNKFDYEVVYDDEVFIFLSQKYWGDYINENGTMMTLENRQWLEERFELYKNKKRIFLFYHQYIDNEDGFAYKCKNDEVRSNSFIKVDDEWWREMISKYKNIIWFSGHSHTSFDRKEGIYYNNNGEYCNMFHVPSNLFNEYYIVDINESVNIKGFKDNDKVVEFEL